MQDEYRNTRHFWGLSSSSWDEVLEVLICYLKFYDKYHVERSLTLFFSCFCFAERGVGEGLVGLCAVLFLRLEIGGGKSEGQPLT